MGNHIVRAVSRFQKLGLWVRVGGEAYDNEFCRKAHCNKSISSNSSDSQDKEVRFSLAPKTKVTSSDRWAHRLNIFEEKINKNIKHSHGDSTDSLIFFKNNALKKSRYTETERLKSIAASKPLST